MKQHNYSELLQMAASYCSMAERCISDVSRKITDAGASPETADKIIKRLVQEKFIDETRFCRSFVNDKFKFNRWGRIKISYELRGKNIQGSLIDEAIGQLDENEYETVLNGLLKDKKKSTKGKNEYDTFQKLYRFAAGRGFESSLIVKQLKKILHTDFDVDSDT
ncbi:MAG: RecX family transcriptional regulator [Tannerella sp.]|jgi:regulatory protein|nr:RecX family transcriptional regulator [Tannerella sp.]